MHKIIVTFLFFCVSGLYAQKITVLDSETKEPISNVAVYNASKTKTALTDFDGIVNLDAFGIHERIFFKHLSYQFRKVFKNQLTKNSTIYLVLKAEQLDEVVLSVSKWEQQKKDIPNRTASIKKGQIEFETPQTAADLLQNSGKIFVQKSQLGGGSPMIRGFATNRLLLSVDGVRMNNAIFRGGNIQNVISIDPFTVKNTEVIFGPGSVIYGSDAIGGVMNFYTLKPTFSHTDSVAVSSQINYRFSSASTENAIHGHINFGHKKWAFLSSLSYTNFGDVIMGAHGPESYLRNTYVARQNDTDVLLANPNPKKQLPSGYSQISAMQKVAYKVNSASKLDLGLHYSETSDYSRYDRLIRPGTNDEGLRSAEWYYGPQKWFLGNLQYSKIAKNSFFEGVKITNAYQYFEESRHDRNFLATNLFSTKEKVDAWSTNIDFESKKKGKLRMYYGGEYVFNKVRSTGEVKDIETNVIEVAASRYPDGATWQTLAGYFNTEYKTTPSLTFLSGVRYSHVWMNAEFDKTFYPFPFDTAKLDNGALTGSIGLSWFPKADLQVTLNGSTGFRAPNIDDIGKVFDSEPGAVVVPNLDLEPEYAYNAEVGLHKNFNDKLALHGTAYYTYLVDALVRRDFTFNGESEILYNGELSSVQAIQNAAKAYVYGFEFMMEFFATDNITLKAHYTITEGIEEEPDGTDTPARHVAPHFGDFHVVWKNQKLQSDVFLNYNGELPFSNLATSEQSKPYIYASDENGNPFSPSWYTLNLRNQYKFTSRIKGNFNIDNITNQRYRTYSSGIVAPGINVVLGLQLDF